MLVPMTSRNDEDTPMEIRARRQRDVVLGYVLLPHAVPIVAVMTATAAFALIARGGWPGWTDLGALLIAMLGGQVAVGVVNELVDVELDRAGKQHKPIPAGLVTERGAHIMLWVGLALMVLGSLRFSLAAFALCALGTGLGIAYSFWFKRTPWSWVPYVLAIPLLPLWVWTALDEVPVSLLAMYPIAIPALVAVQLAQSIPDIEGDARAGVRTLAVILGVDGARLACHASIITSAALAAVLAPLAADRAVYGWIGSAGAVVLVGINAALWRRNEHVGRMSCFPLVAAAVVALGVGWALAAVS